MTPHGLLSPRKEAFAIRFGPRTAGVALLAAAMLGGAPAALAFGGNVLRYGSPDHADVRILQADLRALGYGVSVDGVFGPSTLLAVKAFQRAHHLTPDGIVGQATYRALAQAEASRGSASPPAMTSYRVQPGDTLSSIAARFGTTAEALATANGLSLSAILQVGQVLTVPAASTAATTDQTSVAEALVHAALALLGAPYAWGGTSPAGFDCSGFVQYVAAEVGIHLPRTSQAQYGVGTPVGRQDLAPGDLVFFNTYGWASHVGVYIGDGRFVDAPASGGVVSIQSLSNPYWADTYLGARDIIP
jgi:cell wall-associated NlpC family hydrolase